MGGGGRGLEHVTTLRADVGAMDDDLELPAHTSNAAYDELLSNAPRGGDVQRTLERLNAEYVNKDAQFTRDGKPYKCQYSQIYFQRLMRLKQVLMKRVEEQWAGVPVVGILDMKPNQDCCVLGTIFKEMKLKPSIMSEYASEPVIASALAGAKLTDPSDTVILEDESARMKMAPADGTSAVLDTVVTGVIVAVRGMDNEGVFEVTDVLFPGMPPQEPLPAREDDAYVAIMSGMSLGKVDQAGEEALRTQLAIDYLNGLLGSPLDQDSAAKVVRVVVAGGIIEDNKALAGLGTKSTTRARTTSMNLVRDADMALTQLASGVPVDVMPGAGDPATASLPQQPLHRCLLPGAAGFPTVIRATNPHAFEVGGVSFLGGSGQTVDDIYKFSTCEDRLDIMAATLQWSHLSPTSPDTLPTFPFEDRDPFILTESPHCYFMGNQPSFATKTVQGPEGKSVRLICVPRFCESGDIVLVNLKTMACRILHFDEPML